MRKLTKTGWVIKNEECEYYNDPTDYFEGDIDSATIYDRKKDAKAGGIVLWQPHDLTYVKVEWYPKQVREV